MEVRLLSLPAKRNTVPLNKIGAHHERALNQCQGARLACYSIVAEKVKGLGIKNLRVGAVLEQEISVWRDNASLQFVNQT